MNTLQDAEETKIKKHLASIRFWINEGMTASEAIKEVRSNSILGEKIWAKIESQVSV